MAPYVQLTDRKKCVAIDLAIEKFFNTKLVKTLNFHHSTVTKLGYSSKTGYIERKSGSGRKRPATIAEDRYFKQLCQQNRYARVQHLKIGC